ncbi:MAG: DUF433 domain-containing protein [Saprospiraceae bacterium]
MEKINRITVDSQICNGKPTIRGKRITVQTILEYLQAGDTKEDILYQYPSLVKEDIDACLQFAIELMKRRYIIKQAV